MNILSFLKEISTEIASNHLETFKLIDIALISDYIKYFSSKLSLLYSTKVLEKNLIVGEALMSSIYLEQEHK